MGDNIFGAFKFTCYMAMFLFLTSKSKLFRNGTKALLGKAFSHTYLKPNVFVDSEMNEETRQEVTFKFKTSYTK